MSHRQILTPSTEIHFNSIVIPGPTLIKPQNNFVVWQNTVTVTLRDVWLQHFTLRIRGTVDWSCLQFLRFYLDGKQHGRTIQFLADKCASFSFENQPVKLAAGNRSIRVKADLSKGQGHFQFVLQDSESFSFLDSDWLPIIPGVGQREFHELATGIQEVG